MTTTERDLSGAAPRMMEDEWRTYFKSDHWASLRAQARVSMPYRCSVPGCRTPRRRLELHHRHYATLGCETMADVEWLCEWHHRRRHGTRS